MRKFGSDFEAGYKLVSGVTILGDMTIWGDLAAGHELVPGVTILGDMTILGYIVENITSGQNWTICPLFVLKDVENISSGQKLDNLFTFCLQETI